MSDDNSGISKASNMITGVARALVSLLIALIVLFVLAQVVFPNDVATTKDAVKIIPDAIDGLKKVVGAFVDGKFTGLLALILFVGFLNHGKKD